jgi:sortase A
MAWRRRLRWLERGALIIGLLCLGLWSVAHFRSWAFQSAESRKLRTASREAGPALGRIEIPRLGIRAIVVEGTDAQTLELAVGHIASTASPGKPGNCGLAGHRDTFFSGLGGARAGDLVRFSTPERTYTYEVEWCRVVEPDRVDTLDPTPVPSLTLVTCYPFAFVGRAPRRFVVRARQVKAPEVPVLAHASSPLALPDLMAASRPRH